MQKQEVKIFVCIFASILSIMKFGTAVEQSFFIQTLPFLIALIPTK